MTARLALFLSASAVLHGALLLLASGAPVAWIGGQRVTVLSVSLSLQDEPSRPARERLASRRAPAPTGTAPDAGSAALSPAIAPLDHTAQPLQPAASAQTAAAAPSDGNAVEEEGRARIQARLRALLDRYFEYPYAARLRGWQGEVQLRFRLQADGRLDELRVARSSGFAVLDTSALHSLARIGRLEEAVEWLHGRSLEMQIAVVYRLRDGT